MSYDGKCHRAHRTSHYAWHPYQSNILSLLQTSRLQTWCPGVLDWLRDTPGRMTGGQDWHSVPSSPGSGRTWYTTTALVRSAMTTQHYNKQDIKVNRCKCRGLKRFELPTDSWGYWHIILTRTSFCTVLYCTVLYFIDRNLTWLPDWQTDPLL